MQSKDLNSDTAKALQAHQTAKNSSQSSSIDPAKVSSLNQLLQWSTANSTEPSHQSAPSSKTSEQIREERQWLDSAFPDIYAGIRELVALLESTTDVSQRVDALEALQEYFLDLNFAQNIHKVGALHPVLRAAQDDNPAAVRASAIWVLGTAMKDMPEVKLIMLQNNVHKLISVRLNDSDNTTRAKAVMAASALLRHSDPQIITTFRDVGGVAAMRARLADTHIPTRRRARFFLQHAPETGNTAFVQELLHDRQAVANLSASLADLDVDDVADVEAAIGALNVLVNHDLPGLMQVAPELPGVLEDLAARCTEHNSAMLVRNLSSRLA